MSIEMTVSEIAEVLGLSRQAINNRVKELPEEDTDKNDKGVTVVTRSGLIKLEEIYKKTIFEDEPVSEDVKQRELMEILVDEKNAEIIAWNQHSYVDAWYGRQCNRINGTDGRQFNPFVRESRIYQFIPRLCR